MTGVALGCVSGHVAMLVLVLLLVLLRRGFLGVGSTVRRMLRVEEMGQSKNLRR